MDQIQEFCRQYHFPDEAVSALAAGWETLQGNEKTTEVTYMAKNPQ